MAKHTLWSEPAYVEKALLEEQRHADYDIKEYPVEVLVAKLDSGDIIIPDYQRDFVWEPERQSKFVESLLLGLPVPYLFAADLPATGKLEMIDGVQRLQTLKRFFSGELALRSLEKLGFLDGLKFGDLPESQQRRFRNRTLRMIVLTERADQDIRFDIFERINTGSVPLSPAEVRRGAYPGPCYDIVKECAESALFRKVCPLSPPKKKRREGEELVLRFFAYSERYKVFDHDVAKFLNKYLRDRNDDPAGPPDIHTIKSWFEGMLRFVDEHFDNKFAKASGTEAVPRVRFEAISVGVHLALLREPKLRPRDMAWVDSQEFKAQTTTDASNSGPKLRARIEYVRDQLLVGANSK